MGSITGRRVYPEPVSCEWAWIYSEASKTRIYRAIGRSTSDDSSGQTLSDWERMEYSDDGDLEETRE